MRVHITVTGPGPDGVFRGPRPFLVEAPAGSTARDLAAVLAGTRTALRVDGRVVADTAPIGLPPLIDGAAVSVDGASSRPDDTDGANSAKPSAGAGWELWVLSGPAAGERVMLGLGRHVVGRLATSALVVDDADVSRRHLQVIVGADGVSVRDLDSANGSRRGGIPLGPVAEPVDDGSTISVASTLLEVRRSLRQASRVHPDGVGHLVLEPPLPAPPDPDPSLVAHPPPQQAPTRSRFPLVALLVPLVLAGGIAAVTRSPTMLLFGLTGPVLSVSAWWGQRRAGRSTKAATAHREAVEQACRELEEAASSERSRLLLAHPAPSAVLRDVQDRAPSLWSDDPESLCLRVGLGRRPATSRFAGDGAPDPPDLDDAPITVTWPAGAVAIVGPRPLAIRAAANLVGRAVSRLPPTALQVCVVAADPGDWQWMAMLPHARHGNPVVALGAVAAEVRSRESAVDAAERANLLVLVGQSEAPTGGGWAAELAGVLRSGPAVGVHVVAMHAHRGGLPSAVGTVLHVRSATEAILETPEGATTVIPDLPSARWADQLARALCPLRVGGRTGRPAGLPAEVRLLEVLDLVDGSGSLEGPALAEAWRGDAHSTRVVLGVTADGPLEIELTQDGPHALVAGTTGSGKSELLRSLVAGLALRNRPDEMVFVLVDYKGGATFRECSALPHVVGVVTDLDDHLARRALAALRAEVRRRELLLRAAGVDDLAAYQRLALPALPRLVLVVDEFRVLAEELPDFVTGLVRLAAVGRSLGIHLVLATQRPGGVVTTDIRANVGLRIALRVRDRADSVDVVDSPAAALLAATTPGRAVVRGSSTALTTFQAALVSGVSPRRLDRVRVTPGWGVAGGTGRPAGPTDLDAIVSATREAAACLGIAPVASPWLPPLPDTIEASTLSCGPDSVAVGLLDDPAGQSQRPWCWDLRAGGHLGIAGGPGSGRTTALVSIAASLGRLFSPADLHLYAVGPGALSVLKSMPHVAGVATLDDPGGVALVLDGLRSAMRAVPVSYATGESCSYAGPTRPGLPGGGPRWLVLLVDGWEQLAALSNGQVAARVRALLDSGTASGFRVVMTGGRALLAGQLTSVLTHRLVLKVSDPMELTLAGIPTSGVPARQPPGRAVEVGTAREVQIALADPRHPDVSRWPATGGPSRVRRLPRSVSRSSLHAVPGLVPVGVRDGDLATVGFRLDRGERRVVVVGPPRSGRTTALATLGHGLLALGMPVVVVGPDLAALLPETVHCRAADLDALVALRQEHENLALLVDDTERSSGTPLEAVAIEIARLVDDVRGFVAAASAPASLTRPGLTGELARAHTGIVLWPEDGTVLGVRTQAGERLGGRGVVSPGGPVPTQIAWS